MQGEERLLKNSIQNSQDLSARDIPVNRHGPHTVTAAVHVGLTEGFRGIPVAPGAFRSGTRLSVKLIFTTD